MPAYAFRGNAHFIDCLGPRLAQAGFSREGEVEAAQTVITYATSMTQLEDLYFGDDGLLQHMNEGTLVVEMSPVTPNFANEVNAVVTLSGYAMVTAPLVVDDKVATDALAKGNVRTFCYGEDGALPQAQPLLDAVYAHCEERGSAAACQLSRMALTIQDAAQLLGAIETEALFKAAHSVTFGSEMGSRKVQGSTPVAQRVLDAVAQKRFSGTYTIEMMMAELSSVMMAADDHELILPQVESAFHLLELLAIIGGASKNPAALSLVYGSDHDGENYGLDWSRADSLYAAEESYPDEEDEDFDDGDDYLNEMFGISTGYSSN